MLARYAFVSILGSIVSYSDAIQSAIATLMDNYQADAKAAALAVTLGIVGAVFILLTKDWLLWLIITSSVGQLFIRFYRDIVPSHRRIN